MTRPLTPHMQQQTTSTWNALRPHSSFTPTCRTCTGLRIACADCIANTLFAAIRRHRVAACSLVRPAATSPGASAVTRPASVQCTVARNSICSTVQKQPTQSHMQYQQHNTVKPNIPRQACVLHTLVQSPTQSLPPLAGAGLLQFLL